MRLWPWWWRKRSHRHPEPDAIDKLAESADARLQAAKSAARDVAAGQVIVDRRGRESAKLAQENSFGALMRNAFLDKG